MNTKQQCIAIAKACGATWVKVPPQPENGFSSEYHPKRLLTFTPDDLRILPLADPRTHDSTLIPDYTSDLNAMHEAEKVLNEAQRCTYCGHLRPIGGHTWTATHTTAAQRAEAFLKTLNLWEP